VIHFGVLLMVVAIAADPPAPAQKRSFLPPPRAVLVAPKARAALELASRFAKKPIDAAWIDAIGVSLDAPAHAYLVGDEIVIELAAPEGAVVDAAFELALAKKKAKRLAAAGDVDRAIELVVDKRRLFVARSGTRLFVADSRGGWPSTAIAAAFAATKPAAAPKWISKPAVIWGTARGAEGVERVEGAVFVEGREVEVRVNAALDFAAGLLVADLAQSPGKSRVLIKDADVVAEVTAHVASSAVANAFELAGISVALANKLSGRFHVALTRGGALIAAVEPRSEVGAEDAAAIKTALGGRLEGVEVRVVKALEEERAPIEGRAKPRELIGALEARSKTKGRIRLLRPEVAVARARLGDSLAKIEALRAELAFTGAGIELRANLVMD
jgi:hypothetical protein